MSAGARRIAVVYRDPEGALDAIADHGHMLVRGLRDEGADATLALLPDAAVRPPSAPLDAIVVNYNPFSWGRRGWAPELPVSLARLRARPARPRIALMVHETAVPLGGAKQTLMGLWQRAQLVALLRLADVAFVTIAAWMPLLRRWSPAHVPVHQLPAGSTVPDMRPARERERARLGVHDGAVVLAMFGGSHPSRLTGALRQAVHGAALGGRRVVVLNLGAGAPDLGPLPPSAELVAPGFLPAGQVAALLSAADVFAAPFVDGVSLRRSTVAAALQHGLPVVSTAGRLTDPVLAANGALRLVPVGDHAAFGAAVARLVEHPEERHAMARHARILFDDVLDWRVIAGQLLRHVA